MVSLTIRKMNIEKMNIENGIDLPSIQFKYDAVRPRSIR